MIDKNYSDLVMMDIGRAADNAALLHALLQEMKPQGNG
jgi:hypothetical protein